MVRDGAQMIDPNVCHTVNSFLCVTHRAPRTCAIFGRAPYSGARTPNTVASQTVALGRRRRGGHLMHYNWAMMRRRRRRHARIKRVRLGAAGRAVCERGDDDEDVCARASRWEYYELFVVLSLAHCRAFWVTDSVPGGQRHALSGL